MRRSLFVLLILAVCAVPAPLARAAPFHDFNEAVAEAYRHYRQTVFYLRTGNTAVASLELHYFARKWKEVVQRFAANPPGPYTADPVWRQTLLEIEGRIGDGTNALAKGDSKRAAEVLAPIRQALSSLRRRNGVFVFSDCVNEANSAMERLYRYRHRPPDFAHREEVDALRHQTAITTHWYERCREQAPAAYRENPQFTRLMETSLYSLSRIWLAIAEKDERRLINILRELHSSDQILFLRFG